MFKLLLHCTNTRESTQLPSERGLVSLEDVALSNGVHSSRKEFAPVAECIWVI